MQLLDVRDSDTLVCGGLPLPESALCRGQILAFGPEAIHYVRNFPSDVSLIACDGTHAELALAEAVRRRRQGIPTLVAPLIGDNKSMVSRCFAHILFMHDQSLDGRRSIFEALASPRAADINVNGQTLGQSTVYTPQTIQTLGHFMQCGDAVIVRSQAERSRLQKIYSTLPQYVSVVPGFDSTVPGTVPDVDADRLVVWAPNVSAGELSVYAFAFLEHHQPVDFICLGELSDVPHHYYSIHDAERVLRKASVIIDASVNDPSTSIAFAGRGFGLACAESSGAHEYIRGCLTYDPMSFSSIMAAAARARADRRTSCIYRSNDELVLRQTLAAAQPERSKEQPFVSIVMATYNRPEHVRANLMQLKKQTYQNFEVIVVNDCGSSVKHIVDEFPFAKYMETPRNSGAAATLNVGLKAARGKYLAAVADDDRFYPNFLASSVAALEASRLPIVYGNIIVRLEKQAQDGQILTEGYCLNWDGTHDPLAVYWAMPNSVQGYLIRRDVMEKVDYYTEDLVCYSDHDFSIKLSKISDFVHNASVVGHMAWRCDGSNLSQIRVRNGEHAKEMQRAFERQCPPDRPLIAARQGMSVQGCLNAQSRPLFFVPAIPLNPVMPVESLSHS